MLKIAFVNQKIKICKKIWKKYNICYRILYIISNNIRRLLNEREKAKDGKQNTIPKGNGN